jgi:hypothetical protein
MGQWVGPGTGVYNLFYIPGPLLQRRLLLHCFDDLLPGLPNKLLVLLIQMGLDLRLDDAFLVALAYCNVICWQILEYIIKLFHDINTTLIYNYKRLLLSLRILPASLSY